MPNVLNREIQLRSRPLGPATLENFEMVETDVPTPGSGQVLVRNSYFSVDPYMRARMDAHNCYVPPFQIGKTLEGQAVGQVVASIGHADFKVGDYVQSMNGWREWYVSSGGDLLKVVTQAPLASLLGALGASGLAAYVGLLHIGALTEYERVFVSAAAGAVGSIACQIAKIKGCYVVGSVGSSEKEEYLKSLGADRTINYKTCSDLNAAVTEAFPDGIDVYFENVGGTHLEAAINNMRQGGRIPICGMLNMYNVTEPPPGPRNLSSAIGLGLTLRGFLALNYRHLRGDFQRDMAGWVTEGKMKFRETVVDGVENSPEAFIGLFNGANIGKMIVRVGPDQAV